MTSFKFSYVFVVVKITIINEQSIDESGDGGNSSAYINVILITVFTIFAVVSITIGTIVTVCLMRKHKIKMYVSRKTINMLT